MLRSLFSILCVLAATAATRGSDADGGRVGAALSGGLPYDVGESSSAGHLPFFYDVYTFRGEEGGTTVVAAVAVPVKNLRAERRDGRVRYRFDLRFVLADTARRSVVSSIDSVFFAVPRALPGQHLLHTYVETVAPPSTTTVQRVIVTDAARPGRGQLYTTPFLIPDYSGPELMLSDIALGLPGATAGWTRRGVTLALLPTSEFPESSFDVYYEIYNLAAGTPYETEISFERLDGPDGDEGAVRMLFSGESTARADDSMGELRRVQSGLAKGRYRLTVTVRNQVSGATASSSRPLQVRGWRRGTTLVPAMPKSGAGARSNGPTRLFPKPAERLAL